MKRIVLIICVLIFTTSTSSAYFVAAKTGAVFHDPNCRYAKTITVTVSFATYEDAVKFGKRPCSTCKPQPTVIIPPQVPYDINSPVFGRDANELFVSINRHIAESERILPTATADKKRELIPMVMSWQLWRVKYLCGEPNSTPIHCTVESDRIIMSWSNL